MSGDANRLTFGCNAIEAKLLQTFTLSRGNNGPLITFCADGTVEIGPGLTADEAGKAAVEAMRVHFKAMIDSAIAAEREACASMFDVDDWPSGDGGLRTSAIKPRTAASAIRSRPTKGEGG